MDGDVGMERMEEAWQADSAWPGWDDTESGKRQAERRQAEQGEAPARAGAATEEAVASGGAEAAATESSFATAADGEEGEKEEEGEEEDPPMVLTSDFPLSWTRLVYGFPAP